MDFRFEINADVWMKSDGSDQDRRIGGICTTDDLDRQSEVVLQDGLDFDPFLKAGWFNDNHEQGMDAILGYPTAAEMREMRMRKGWYVEGYLLKGAARADAVWMLANALQKTDRRLGFSVEGSVLDRDPSIATVVRKAVVRNVAITHCPVNTATTLNVLVKSLAAGASSGVIAPRGVPTTAGGVLAPQSIEASPSPRMSLTRETIKKRKKKLSDVEERVLSKAEHGEPLTRSEAVDLLILMAGPRLSRKQAEGIADFSMRHYAR